MKQVTMESIRQRIADLESAGKVVGGLSLSSEFELACLRELVAVTEQVRLLTEQRDAVVVEMSKFKAAHPQPFGPEMMKALEAYEWHQDDVPETGMLNAFFILRDSIFLETPATDAALASLRAKVLPPNIAEIIDSGDLETICWHSEHASSEDFRLALYNFRQLRESKGESKL